MKKVKGDSEAFIMINKRERNIGEISQTDYENRRVLGNEANRRYINQVLSETEPSRLK